jgi:hypothetical protein
MKIVLCRINGGESYEIQIVDLGGWGDRLTIGAGNSESEAWEKAESALNQLGQQLRTSRAAAEKAKLKKWKSAKAKKK